MMAPTAQEKRFEREMSRLMARFKRNHLWILAHRKELEPYTGRYVAVDNGRVLASSRTEWALRKRFLRRQYVCIDYVDPPGLVRILTVAAH